jgi:hypothetical protein
MDKCNLIGIVDVDRQTLITSIHVENTNDTPKFFETINNLKKVRDAWHRMPGFISRRLEIREIERKYLGGWRFISDRQFI